MSKNKIYLVELSAGQFRQFTDWPSCQAFVSGKPYAFAGGATEAEAKAKIEAARRKQGGYSKAPASASSQSANATGLLADPDFRSKPKPFKVPPRFDGPSLAKPFDIEKMRSLPEPETQSLQQAPQQAKTFPKATGGIASQLVFELPSGTPKAKTGICCDAGTHGNPGPCEFQVANMQGAILVHKHLGVHSNNYAELAGIEAMIQYGIQHEIQELYTDSKVCMFWIRKGDVGPSVHEPGALKIMIASIRELLLSNRQLRLLKWPTKRWGQVPADFGRK